MSTRLALTTASKGASTVAEFFVKMKGLADDMASAGKKLEDEELVSFILAGLGDDFESIVTAMATRVEPLSVNELYAQLIAFEQRKEINNGHDQSSANLANKGGRGGNNFSGYSNSNQPRNRNDAGRGGYRRGGGGGGRGNGGRGNGGNNGEGAGRNFLQGVFCQLCGKEGHLVVRCFKRFNPNFTGPPQKSASSASTTSYGADTNWYVDSGATDHITGELEKLSYRDNYRGGEQVHTASGAGMKINHIGHSTLYSPIRDIRLKNVLHVPSASKNLVSAHHLVKDNNAFLELHPKHFSLK